MAHWRDAFRIASRQPAFTLLIVTMLTLGIGGATAMFSAVRGVLLKPLPYEQPKELVWMYGAFRLNDSAAISPPDFLDYRARNHVFESLGAMVIGPNMVTVAKASDPERLNTAYVSAGLITTLGVSPLVGRDFFREEESSTAAQPVIISERLWRQQFGASPDALGRTVRVDDNVRTIVGVMPAGFALPFEAFIRLTDPVDLYAPHVVLRMAAPSQAGPLLRDTVRSLDRNVAVGRIQSLEQLLHESLSQPRFRTVLAMLFASLALALTLGGLYGSVSWAVAQRTREFGIRSALGAKPRQLLTLVLRQGMWIIALGALLGLAGAYTCGRFVQELLYETRPFEASVVTSVTILLVALSTVAAIVPAWRAGRIDPAVTLRIV